MRNALRNLIAIIILDVESARGVNLGHQSRQRHGNMSRYELRESERIDDVQQKYPHMKAGRDGLQRNGAWSVRTAFVHYRQIRGGNDNVVSVRLWLRHFRRCRNHEVHLMTVSFHIAMYFWILPSSARVHSPVHT